MKLDVLEVVFDFERENRATGMRSQLLRPFLLDKATTSSSSEDILGGGGGRPPKAPGAGGIIGGVGERPLLGKPIWATLFLPFFIGFFFVVDGRAGINGEARGRAGEGVIL